jgi:hypothetical protein
MKTALKTAFIVLCCFGAAAHATVMKLNYIESFGFSSNDRIFDQELGQDDSGENNRTLVRDSQLISIDRFDSTLGELLNVSIWFETEWNLAAVVQSYDKRFGIKTATGKGRSISNQAVRLIDPNGEAESNHEVLRTSCSGIYSCSDSKGNSGIFSDGLNLSDFSLSDFIGTDGLDFEVERTLIADLTYCGYRDNCYQRNNNNAWGGSIFVSYTYDDSPDVSVPEPSTLVLLGMGLLGIGATRLGRKRNS